MFVPPENAPFTMNELITRGLTVTEAAWLVYQEASFPLTTPPTPSESSELRGSSTNSRPTSSPISAISQPAMIVAPSL